MRSEEAKQILLLYRPGLPDELDPEIAGALALANDDPGLRRWFDEHCRFQRNVRAQLRAIKAPTDLKRKLLATPVVTSRSPQSRTQPAWLVKTWGRRPAWIVAAACVVAMIGLAAFWLRPHEPGRRFSNFQARMVGTVLREYRMDLVTSDMAQLRQYMASRGAPHNYDLTRGLERLRLTGGGLLRWRNHPVSMTCFDRGDNQMLFLFVVQSSAFQDPPSATPSVTKVNQLMTVSWRQGDMTYLLAGPEETHFEEKYL